MPSSAAQATMWRCPNFVGPLFKIGANQTPFLNMIGGLQGGNVLMVKAFEFPLNVQYSLDAASQPAISETSAATGPGTKSFLRTQDRNVCQVFHYGVDVTYAAQSVAGNVKVAEVGATGFGYVDITQDQAVDNALDFQITANLQQAAVDVEYTFLRGAYQYGASAATAWKTRGICTSCTTNTVAAGTTPLTQALIRNLVRTMAGNGATFTNPVIFTSAFQVQKISELYGFAPQDRTVGGVAIKQVVLDIAGNVGIVWAPYMATNVLLLADMAKCRPVFLEVPTKGVLFYEELARAGATTKGQVYGQIGLDYTADDFHGTITGLTTS